MGASLPGALVRMAVMGFAAQLVGRDLVGRQVLQHLLLCGRGRRIHALEDRRAELVRQLIVDFARILAACGANLGGQQPGDNAVLVGRPDGAVFAQEGGACALLAHEAAPPVLIISNANQELKASKSMAAASRPKTCTSSPW